MSHTRFDDNIGLDRIDRLLSSDHVLWELNYRTAHPRERVSIPLVPSHPQPFTGKDGEGLVRVERQRSREFGVLDFQSLLRCVEDEFHRV